WHQGRDDRDGTLWQERAEGRAGHDEEGRSGYGGRQGASVHRADEGQRRQGTRRGRPGDHRRRAVEDGLLRRRRAGQDARSEITRRWMTSIAPLLLLFALSIPSARADLWAYVDEQGQSHLANRQVDARYKLFF